MILVLLIETFQKIIHDTYGKLLKNFSFIKQLHKFTNMDGLVGGGIGSFICSILCK
jgi:hypothetical protein